MRRNRVFNHFRSGGQIFEISRNTRLHRFTHRCYQTTEQTKGETNLISPLPKKGRPIKTKLLESGEQWNTNKWEGKETKKRQSRVGNHHFCLLQKFHTASATQLNLILIIKQFNFYRPTTIDFIMSKLIQHIPMLLPPV